MELRKTGTPDSPSNRKEKPDFTVGENSPGLATYNNTQSRPYSVQPKYEDSVAGLVRNSAFQSSTPVQKVCVTMGSAFILIGLIGFGIPGFFGTHLSPAHNWIHLISGAAALWIGLRQTPRAANRFALGFGTVYGLLGLAGFIFGSPGLMTMPMMAESDRFMLSLVPGQLELGTNDHVLHLIIGAIFLAPAIAELRRSDRFRV